ncbi:MAG: tetratricopeptide repeat protein [bacterium]|nr:tetratricopeptide repeat protein [bacterium]
MSKLSQLKQDAFQAGKKRNWAQAIALYEEILDKDKNNPTVINELGDLCLKSGDTPQAVRHFLSAAAKYRQTGLLNNAVAIYKKILRYEAENQNAHWYLAETRAGQGLAMEGEEHAQHFLQHSGKVAGDIKEIFLKRCVQLLDLLPDSIPVQSALVQIFNMWQMPLESARALCLLGAIAHGEGRTDDGRARIDEALARSPEVTNYPEYARWDLKVNPGKARPDDHFTGFGELALEHPSVSVPMADLAQPAAAPAAGFGNIDLLAPVVPETVPPAVPIEDFATEPAPEDGDILSFGGVRRVADILAQSDPTRDEKDDDGCFEIDSGEDLEALVSEALAKSKLHRAVAAPPAMAPLARRDLDDDPLARILNAEPASRSGHETSQLETITSEIGAVVGGAGNGADAERLYEMGMVYLEMGLYDQACESFETAACDDAFAVRAHEMLGITLQRAGRLPEAITALQAGLVHAADGSREQHGLSYHLGRALEQAGRVDEAADCYRQIRAADPTFLDVGHRLKRLVEV